MFFYKMDRFGVIQGDQVNSKKSTVRAVVSHQTVSVSYPRCLGNSRSSIKPVVEAIRAEIAKVCGEVYRC